MFPKTYKCLLNDIIGIGFASGPLPRDESEPGAVFGKPGPPILLGVGIGHQDNKRASRVGAFVYPSASILRPKTKASKQLRT